MSYIFERIKYIILFWQNIKHDQALKMNVYNGSPVEKRVGTDQFLDKIADIPKHESFNKVS